MSTSKCIVCGHDVPKPELVMERELEALVLQQIRKDHPEWQDDDGVCAPCLEELKARVSSLDDVELE